MEQLLERLARAEGAVGFAYKNLATGETAAYGEDRPLMAASLIKLIVLAEAFRSMEAGEADRGELFTLEEEDKLPSCGALAYMHTGLTVTFEDLYTLMIILSDNTATNLLIRRLGMEQINRTAGELGLEKTRLNRLLFDGEAAARGVENITTAGEMALLLELLHQGRVISPAASREMLGILENQRLNGKIPFALPKGVVVAHKTGEDDGITHDVGIVWAREPFVVCFCANGTDVPAFERLIQEGARILCEQAEGGRPVAASRD